ncbi:MAG: four helix bundle protein [Ignavibacteria bacterium RBG_16_34_14]|nr:MAG: four helix bundle protein [Ignavibacteria bacterium RBG_16_34_14]
MKVKSFEDLQVWQDARIFVKSIYELTSLENFKKDFGLKDQVQRSAVSIMNNISEGYERDNNKEFRNFLSYAKGSAGEIRSMLYIALDLNYISKDDFDKNFNKAVNIITQISNFKKYLRNYVIKEKIKNVKMFFIQLLNF